MLDAAILLAISYIAVLGYCWYLIIERRAQARQLKMLWQVEDALKAFAKEKDLSAISSATLLELRRANDQLAIGRASQFQVAVAAVRFVFPGNTKS